MTADARGQRLLFRRDRDGRRQSERQQASLDRALCRQAGSLEFALQDQIELCAWKDGKSSSEPVGLYPQSGNGRQAINGPAGQCAGRKVRHQMRDQVGDQAQSPRGLRSASCSCSQFLPEVEVILPSDDVTAEFDQVCGARPGAAYVLEQMSCLAEKKVSGRKHGGRDAMEVAPLQTAQQSAAARFQM